MTTALVIPAAGRGERLGAGRPKAFVELAGQPLLVHAVRGAVASGVVDAVVVAVPDGYRDRVLELLDGAGHPLTVVIGGASRRASVGAALATLPEGVDSVLVHDAARCLTPPEVFIAVAASLAAGADAVVPAIPVADTIKEVSGDVVTRTPDRSVLRAIQTPQGFRRDVLLRAHSETTGEASDDAGMVEQLGVNVHIVQGHRYAFKITELLDVFLAEAVLARRGSRP